MKLRDLIREIHRRSLWQVLLIYVGASWGAIEAIDHIAARLMLPDWIPGLALVLVVVGFPVVLATAFVQERELESVVARAAGTIPPEAPGDPGRADSPRPGGEPTLRRLLTWRNALGAGVVAFALWGILAAGWVVLGGSSSRPEGPIRRIAVLPLDNFTGDAEQEYFVDGMTEQLITELAQIRGLLVMSRSAVMRYKEHPKPVQEIAQELDIDAVIEGSVLRVEDEVRITAQLIDGRSEAHLWAKDYVRSFNDLLSLQKDVARAIADEIEVNLTPEEEEDLAKARIVDPAAQEAYLKGVYHQRRFQQGGEPRATLETSIEFLNEAVAVEPEWADAHAELARAYHWEAGSFAIPENYRRAKEEALEAIRLDESLAAGHGALAFVLHNYDFDRLAAEREYRRAFELAPGDNYYRWGYGLLLFSAGRYDDAAASFREALKADPFSLFLNRQLSLALACDGRYEEAAENAVRREPDGAFTVLLLGQIALRQGEPRTALRHYERAIELTERGTYSLIPLANAYVSLGRETEARELLLELEEREAWIPVLHARLGDTEQAVAQLERAYEQRSYLLTYLRCDFRTAFTDLTELPALRENPAFQQLLRRLNFPS
jgi:TolB-like protein/Tfp pilus assembly protein PilF